MEFSGYLEIQARCLAVAAVCGLCQQALPDFDGKYGEQVAVVTVLVHVTGAIITKAQAVVNIIQSQLPQYRDVSIQSVQPEYFPAVDLNV